MRSLLDFSSWHTLWSTLIGLLLATLLMVGVRLLFMQTLQRRRERENRQINERLKTLIAAYKTLGGSFTGSLQVHPTHVRDLRRAAPPGTHGAPDPALPPQESAWPPDAMPTFAGSSERQRRIRDAVEAALSDVILLGTPEQVALAAAAARDMVAGRSIETGALVVSLRGFIRTALGLEPIASDVRIPLQGPLRPSMAGGGANARNAGARGEAANAQRGAGGNGGAGAAAGGGMGGLMLGGSLARNSDDTPP